MDSGSPEFWRWVWLIAMVVFGVGEISVAGSFFLAPFAVGAGVAAVLAFLGVPVGIEWIVFIAASVVAFAALRPLAKRLDRAGPVLGIGAHRQMGQSAHVIEAIDGDHDGVVMLGTEQWRAESSDGEVISVGSTVSVIKVRGTRLLVRRDPTSSLPAEPPSA